MNYSKIFEGNTLITIPASAFMQLVHEAMQYDILERSFQRQDKDGFYECAITIFAGDRMFKVEVPPCLTE